MTFFSLDFRFSKRLLGLMLTLMGALGAITLLLIDTLRQTQDGGFGPSQQLAFITMLIITLIGLSLIPLGDKPA